MFVILFIYLLKVQADNHRALGAILRIAEIRLGYNTLSIRIVLVSSWLVAYTYIYIPIGDNAI